MKNIVFLLSVCILLALSCKKKSKTEEESPSTGTTTTTGSNPVAPNLVISVPSDAYGVLIASKIPYEFPGWTTTLGKASAFFYTAPGNYTYVDAGVVKCNDSVIVKQSGGSYYFGGKPINGQTNSGINFSANTTWSVSGNVAPTFTRVSTGFPSDATLTSPLTVNRSVNYNLTLSGATGADSIAIYLGCDSAQVKQVIAGNATSTTFYTSQLASIKKVGSTNKGYFNIIPYSITPGTYSSKKYYFVNTTTSTYTVTVQ